MQTPNPAVLTPVSIVMCATEDNPYHSIVSIRYSHQHLRAMPLKRESILFVLRQWKATDQILTKQEVYIFFILPKDNTAQRNKTEKYGIETKPSGKTTKWVTELSLPLREQA